MFIILSVFCFQCKKSSSPIYEILPETKEWTVFQPGTWWLYKNLRTNSTDTWKVVSYKESVRIAGKTSPDSYKTLQIYIETRLRDTFYYLVTPGSSTLKTSKYFGLFQMCFFNSELTSL